ncbi:MAG: alpha/beta fold hydrolase, partial [Acidimicrobiia bacterium]
VVEDCTVAGIAAAGEAYRNGLLRVGLVRHHDDADALFGAWHDSWLDPAFRSWDIRDGLERIEAPVLLIQGQDDQYGTMAQLDEIEARVRGPVRRLELAACGHSPHLEQREATAEAIAAFLERLPDAG